MTVTADTTPDPGATLVAEIAALPADADMTPVMHRIWFRAKLAELAAVLRTKTPAQLEQFTAAIQAQTREAVAA